ncbi:hypothetical protein BpHYR1_021020 [Brachionus plicatilis]|uniref:G-protein coupled receptors family 1 profile domain-containing protein n=1 Tax=Brachionus plicatilis TaxID=10195 RepID=A0A3M7Q6M2_BRAPC|nr:hypothetical protein BpHYR1_021020 [Brachionus plicatilis]
MDFRNSSLKIDQAVLICTNFVFFPLGLLVNLFQVFFFARKRYMKTTMGPYFIAISLNNIVALSMTAMRFIGLSDFHQIFTKISLWCNIIPFLTRLAFQACSWLNFFYTFDRAIFVLYPAIYNKCNHKNLLVCLIFLLTYIILVLSNLPNLFYEIKEIEFVLQNETMSVCSGSVVVNLVREMLSQAVGIYVPFLLMLAVNLCLVWKVMESRRKFKSVKELNFACPLLVSNLFFLLFQLPFSVYMIYSIILTLNPELHISENFNSFMPTLDTVSRVIACINYSFYLGVQSLLNKTSQKDIKKLINSGFIKCFGNSQRIFPSSRTTTN